MILNNSKQLSIGSSVVKCFPLSLWHKHSNEECHHGADATEVEEQSRGAQVNQDHVRRLNCQEDHQEVECDQTCADQRLQVRTKPFS